MERCVGTVHRGLGESFISIAKTAAKYAYNIKVSVWETAAQRSLIVRTCDISRHTTGGGLGK